MSIPKDGFIYIIQEVDTQLYKVGCTQDDRIEKRKSNLNVGNPHELIFVGCFYTYDMEYMEGKVHEFLSSHYRHVRGEWFELNEVVVENMLQPEWREQQKWYTDNLELTINDIFQEYSRISADMEGLLKRLRHIISRYRVDTHYSLREKSEKL